LEEATTALRPGPNDENLKSSPEKNLSQRHKQRPQRKRQGINEGAKRKNRRKPSCGQVNSTKGTKIHEPIEPSTVKKKTKKCQGTTSSLHSETEEKTASQ